MRRERKPQTQNRMVFKNQDHREIIMEDQYHGAVYIDDDPEPAWRKYKPRLLSMNTGLYNKTVDGHTIKMGANLIGIDEENIYVSGYPFPYYDSFYHSPNFKLGNILYKNIQTIDDNNRTHYYGYASINGYDWKQKEVSVFFDSRFEDVYQYGKYLIKYENSLFNFYEIDYNEGSSEFIEPTIVKQVSNLDRYIGCIETEEHQGALFYSNRSRVVTINLVTGLDLNSQTIFTYNGTNMNYVTVGNLYYCNQRYFLFITYSRRSSSNASYYLYNKLNVLCSEPGDPTTWTEHTVIPEYLYENVVDNDRNRIFYNVQINTCNSLAGFMMYQDSNYYLYMNKTTAAYTPYDIYYKSGSTKVITGHGQDGTDYEKIVVFVSSDLNYWEEHSLPQYVDIPFFWDSDLYDNNGRHGSYLTPCESYNSVRFFLDGNLLRVPSAPYGVLPSEPYYGTTSNQYIPNLIGNFNTLNSNSYIIDNEILNGKIQRIGDSDTTDLWICRPIFVLEAPYYVNYSFYKWIAVHFTDPYFRWSDDEVYLLEGITRSPANVDPISEEDYIFDT